MTAYAGYSEANRAPTPLELGCADPAHPCIIASFLVSDPPLKQVVSRTVEAGLRGTKDLNIGTLGWKLGVFRADNTDDILAIPSPVLQGFGYFQNVGSTRRQGIEAEANLRSSALQLYASYALVDARFLDALQVGSNSPFADANGNVQILPGNQIPAIPRQSHQGRLRLFGHRRAQGRRRRAVRQQPVFRRRRIQSGAEAAGLMRSSTCTPRIRSTRPSRSTRASTISSTIAMRPTGRSSTPAPCPISPMAARQFTDPRSVSPARPRALLCGPEGHVLKPGL